MAEDDNPFAPRMTSPAAEWVPLMHGPFFFRRRPTSLFERTYAHGWPLKEVVERATAISPPADPEDPNPISIWANEGEGRLWVQWTFATERTNSISLIPYFADDLDADDQIKLSILSRQSELGQYPPEQLADLGQAVARIKYFWSVLIQQFHFALDSGAVRLMARVSDPMSPFRHVPYDSFRQYQIKSWRLGNAVSATGEGPNLYSLHVDPLSEPVPQRTLDPELMVGGTITIGDASTESRPTRRRAKCTETAEIEAPPRSMDSAERQQASVREAARGFLIQGLSQGEISIREVQDESLKVTGKPLIREPSASEFVASEIDPFRQARWTLPMAIAWIADLRADSVRREMRAWADRCYCLFDEEGQYYWQENLAGLPQKRKGYTIQRMRDGSAIRLLHFHPERSRYTEAKERLWAALDQGNLEARARKYPDTERALIDRHRWQDLEIYPGTQFERDKPFLLQEHLRDEPLVGQPQMYYDVSMECADILRLWPAKGTASETSVGRRGEVDVTTSPEIQFFARLKADMNSSPGKPIKRKASYREDALAKGITERAFNRLWSTAVLDTGASAWSKGGRPKGIAVKNSGK